MARPQRAGLFHHLDQSVAPKPWYVGSRDQLSPLDRRRLREKRGLKEGEDYRPWVEVTEMPSGGSKGSKRYLIKGRKSNRLHHLLSNGEAALFKSYEWRNEVVEIREQFPLLPQTNTILLSEQLGVAHPRQGADPMVLTIDFLLTVMVDGQLQYRAISFKMSKSLDEIATVRRQELERRFLTDYGIDGKEVKWSVVTERELPETLLRNLNNLQPDWDLLGRHAPDALDRLHEHLNLRWTPDIPLIRLAREADEILSLQAGTALAYAQKLILDEEWGVNLFQEIFRPNRPLSKLIIRSGGRS